MPSQPVIGVETTRSTTATQLHGITLGRAHLQATVFSTPSMILLMELTAKDLLAPHLEPDEDSVGVTVTIEHLAPTPLNTEIRTVAKLDSIEKRQYTFTVEAFDSAGLIGRGTHTRAIVRLPKFSQILSQRHPASTNALPSPPRTDRLKLEISGPTAHLILNRPDKLNAIDEPMTTALESALSQLESTPTIRLLILRAEGRAFCAGEDIKENASLTPEQSSHQAQRRAVICRRLGALPFPVIARIQGPCMGGGLILALGADWLLATPDASFALPEITLGWPPAYGMETLLSRIGFAHTRDLCLLATPLTARQAEQAGLISKVLQPTMIDREIEHLSKSLLALSPSATKETRALLRPASSDSQNLAAYARARAHPDAQSGINRFLKRS